MYHTATVTDNGDSLAEAGSDFSTGEGGPADQVVTPRARQLDLDELTG
jgi:hypothetical protein